MEFCQSEIIVFVIHSNFSHDSETWTFIMILSFCILINFTPNLMQFILIYIPFTYNSNSQKNVKLFVYSVIIGNGWCLGRLVVSGFHNPSLGSNFIKRLWKVLWDLWERFNWRTLLRWRDISHQAVDVVDENWWVPFEKNSKVTGSL